MNLSNIDLNLLTIFEAILKERNLTRAGKRVGLSQPATSNALGRLRTIFNDPLFIRTSQGMQPTPLSEELTAPINKIMNSIRETLNTTISFNSQESTQTYHIIMSDYAELVILPHLVKWLYRNAPGITIDVMSIPRNKIQKSLENGEVDLAIGAMNNTGQYLGTGVYQKSLFQECHVCLFRKGHPLLDQKFTLEDYVSQKHALVSPYREGLGVIDSVLGHVGLRRKIHLRIPHFVVVPEIIANTDLVISMGERLAKYYTTVADLAYMPIPFDVPVYHLNQYWHERSKEDPASRWLREILTTLCKKM